MKIILVFGFFFISSCKNFDIYKERKNSSPSVALNEISALIDKKYIKSIPEDDLSENAAFGVISKLDEHSDFFSKNDYAIFNQNISGSIAGIGVELLKHEDGAMIMSVIDGSSAQKSGLKTRDIIFQINDTSVDSLSVAKIGQLISGEIGTSLYLSVIDGQTNNHKIVLVKRAKILTNSVEVEKYEKIPVIKIKYFAENTAEMLKNELKKLEKYKPLGLIFDLRNNPGGLLDSALEIASIFLEKGVEIVQVASPKRDAYIYGANGHDYYDFYKKTPIVIIINEGSASGSEILASAIKENKRGKVIGSKSFGKGTVQDIFELQSIKGAAVKLTIAEYFGPNGVKIDKIGVIPDISCDEKAGCDTKSLAKKTIISYY